MKNSVAVTFLLLSTAMPVLSQELPETGDLQSRLVQALPGYWSINDFRVVASALQGDPISPQALVRFEATVAPKSNLFSATGEMAGPFAVVIPTYDADANRTLYGTMQLNYKAGQWSGLPNIENSVANLGQPRDLFTDPTLVLGTKEQKALLAALRDDTVSAAKADIAAELAALKAAGDQRMAALRASIDAETKRLEAERKRLSQAQKSAISELETQYQAKIEKLKSVFEPRVAAETARLQAEIERLQTAHAVAKKELARAQAAEIDDLKTQYGEVVAGLDAQQAQATAEFEKRSKALADQTKRLEEERARLAEEQETTLAQMEAEYQAKIEALKTAYEPQVAAETERLQAEIERLQAAHAKAKKELARAQAAEIAALEMQHAAQVGKLKAEQAEIIAELEAGFTARKQRLQRQLGEAKDIVAAQEATIKTIEMAADNDAYMKELVRQNLDRQKEFFTSLGNVISGSLNCAAYDNRVSDSWPISFSVSSVTGTGMRGTVQLGAEDEKIPASLTLASKAGVKPVVLSFSMDIKTGVGTYDLSMSENGSMRGVSSGNMIFLRKANYGNQQLSSTCIVTLGAGE